MDLLLETLICEAKINNNNNASELFEIPTDFLVIVNKDIINLNNLYNKDTCESNLSKSEKHVWIALGKWLEFERKIKRKEVRQHLQLRWQKLKHALYLHSNEESSVLTTPHITKKKKIICLSQYVI
ncbi:327_t:CDS:1 [Scutellospora calospora]|uniref:327_t:CDS:1 n=1 Tax=Scutellospora calospora TaxID=85575 RepID=A0ACA9LLL7_9GLOM|nr:327_t:CDS:1 [Scutellospora calospora]